MYKKSKGDRRIRGEAVASVLKEKHVPTEREISELTIRRLHTLGNQRFGASPFSAHFDRWLMNVQAVLSEFKSHPAIGVDDQFEAECVQVLDGIRLQLENIRRKEAIVDQETKNLTCQRKLLEQINIEYMALASATQARKNLAVKRLNSSINLLKKEQDRIIRLKTGFFHGVSKKDRERREIAIMQEISDKQRELEMVMLHFNAQLKELREKYEMKREPILEQIKQCKKTIGDVETDDSLEERWFACEALIDAVNFFLQRKAKLSR